MGGGSYSSADYMTYSSTVRSKSASEIFTKRGLDADSVLNPHGVTVRESRDSDEHPNSTAVIVALDVTGSMGSIAVQIAKSGLGTLFQEILDRKPVSDPQLMFMAVGDVRYDSAPLQVSQFESDNRIVDQLTSIYLEGGGGGNRTESYEFPWYFAGRHTSIDCWEKRKKKGYLFTIGDEDVPAGLEEAHIREVLGGEVVAGFSAAECLRMAEEMYHVFHLCVEQGNGWRGSGGAQKENWQNLLGQRAIMLSDYTKLSEVIVSLIQVTEGETKDSVAASWDGSTSIVVSKALNGYNPVAVADKAGTGLVKFD